MRRNYSPEETAVKVRNAHGQHLTLHGYQSEVRRNVWCISPDAVLYCSSRGRKIYSPEGHSQTVRGAAFRGKATGEIGWFQISIMPSHGRPSHGPWVTRRAP